MPTTITTEIGTEFKENLIPNYLLGQLSLDDVTGELQDMYDTYLEDK